MKILKFAPQYRDDLIFMILEAKNALGRVPGLNEDLLDIQANYFDKGDLFWIAVDEHDRVIGSVGYSSIEGTSEIWLHRFFVKAALKHQGISTKLLHAAETFARACSHKMNMQIFELKFHADKAKSRRHTVCMARLFNADCVKFCRKDAYEILM